MTILCWRKRNTFCIFNAGKEDVMSERSRESSKRMRSQQKKRGIITLNGWPDLIKVTSSCGLPGSAFWAVVNPIRCSFAQPALCLIWCNWQRQKLIIFTPVFIRNLHNSVFRTKCLIKRMNWLDLDGQTSTSLLWPCVNPFLRIMMSWMLN